jgi:hypothetical protein
MAIEKYTKKYILEKSLEFIEAYHPSTISELLAFLPCSPKTFYRKIQVDSKEYRQIDEKLKSDKLKVANAAKRKLLNSNNVTALISVIKLYGSEEDKQALNQNVNVNAQASFSYEDVKKVEVNINNLTLEEQKQLNALIEKVKGNG